MPQETLRNHPLCRAEDLGKPVPNTTHAVSMCLPRWQDVVGYEEQDPATMQRLRQGYPRFFYHPLVSAAFEKYRTDTDEAVQIYTTRSAAERCRTYLATREARLAQSAGSETAKNTKTQTELRDIEDSACVLISYPAECADSAKEYWQHTGEGISSRRAEALLNGISAGDACV